MQNGMLGVRQMLCSFSEEFRLAENLLCVMQYGVWQNAEGMTGSAEKVCQKAVDYRAPTEYYRFLKGKIYDKRRQSLVEDRGRRNHW